LFKCDENGREINIYRLNDVFFTGESLRYPNILIYSDNEVYNPIDERIMSLSLIESKKIFNFNRIESSGVFYDPVFFFVYNFDNYYHYIYDTLPYLISFFKLKKTYPNLRLLVNYSQVNRFYNFVIEFLEILGIYEGDMSFVNEDTLYKNVFISSSYTHGLDSNLPPRQEVYDLFKSIIEKTPRDSKVYPKKIYISRRTWINNDVSNIGTNYTTRRKLMIEDLLVERLVNDYGYTEVFTENLTTIEKINMFRDVEVVIGSIGGGVCNVLFSNKKTKLYCLVSPTFLDINSRFVYSFKNVECFYFNDTYHFEKNEWKRYMRVKFNDFFGEIKDVLDEELVVSYLDESVAGWNSEINMLEKKVYKKDCIKLDNGLNSSWSFDIKELIKIIE
jgi:hypothetical protein